MFFVRRKNDIEDTTLNEDFTDLAFYEEVYIPIDEEEWDFFKDWDNDYIPKQFHVNAQVVLRDVSLTDTF